MRYLLGLCLVLGLWTGSARAELPPTCGSIDISGVQTDIIKGADSIFGGLTRLIKDLPLDSGRRKRRSFIREAQGISSFIEDLLRDFPSFITVCLIQPTGDTCRLEVQTDRKQQLTVSLSEALDLYNRVLRSFRRTLPQAFRKSLKRARRGARDLVAGGKTLIDSLPEEVLICASNLD